ncbi:molybdopterin-binding protein, partial [bacterium]|nr:molybdopterin-binding protein [bacterium]
MSPLRAEVISIGDEMTSGVRLDTNSQWLSSRLGELGIEVAFHSTVGDNLADNIDVFQHAVNRVEIVI